MLDKIVGDWIRQKAKDSNGKPVRVVLVPDLCWESTPEKGKPVVLKVEEYEITVQRVKFPATITSVVSMTNIE